MTRAIVRVLSNDERALAGALLLLAARRQRVAELQAELASLTHTLERFAAECQLRLASLFAELDHLRRAIALCERRIARLRSEARARAEGKLPPEPDPELDDEAEWDAEAEAEARRFGRRAGEDRPPTEEDAETAAELKRLYLELARRHHPDLATDPADRERRQELMLRVNAAFSERDIDALRALVHEAEAADAPPTRSAAERLAWTRREIFRIEGLIADLCGELNELRFGETGRLWQRHQAGEAILDHVAGELRREIVSQRLRLSDLTTIQDRLARAARPVRRRTARSA